MKKSNVRPIRRHRPTSAQLAALTQLVVAAVLIASLMLLIWWFFQAVDRLGGARLYIYLPIAMIGFLAFAIFRFVQAYRLLRRAGRERRTR